jgi:hypothetical protein
VRKQYNFWPGDRGLDAWDVDRLIRLSAELPVVDMPLVDIGELDTSYWSTAEAGRPLTVREIVSHAALIQDVDLAYPVILAANGRVMDGMHRIARALLDRDAAVKAVRFEHDPEPDFRDCEPANLPY